MVGKLLVLCVASVFFGGLSARSNDISPGSSSMISAEEGNPANYCDVSKVGTAERLIGICDNTLNAYEKHSAIDCDKTYPAGVIQASKRSPCCKYLQDMLQQDDDLAYTDICHKQRSFFRQIHKPILEEQYPRDVNEHVRARLAGLAAMCMRGGGWRAAPTTMGFLEAMWSLREVINFPGHIMGNSGGTWGTSLALLHGPSSKDLSGHTVGAWDTYHPKFVDALKHAQMRRQEFQKYNSSREAAPPLYNNMHTVHETDVWDRSKWELMIESWFRGLAGDSNNVRSPMSSSSMAPPFRSLGVEATFVATGFLQKSKAEVKLVEIEYDTATPDMPHVYNEFPEDEKLGRYDVTWYSPSKLRKSFAERVKLQQSVLGRVLSRFDPQGVERLHDALSFFRGGSGSGGVHNISWSEAMARSSYAAGGSNPLMAFRDKLLHWHNGKEVKSLVSVFDGAGVDNNAVMPAFRNRFQRIMMVGCGDVPLLIDHALRYPFNSPQDMWSKVYGDIEDSSLKTRKGFVDPELLMLFGINSGDKQADTVGTSNVGNYDSLPDTFRKTLGIFTPNNLAGNQVFDSALLQPVLIALREAKRRGSGVVTTFRLRTLPKYGGRMVVFTYLALELVEKWEQGFKNLGEEGERFLADLQRYHKNGWPQTVDPLRGSARADHVYALRHLAGWTLRENEEHFQTMFQQISQKGLWFKRSKEEWAEWALNHPTGDQLSMPLFFDLV